MKEKKLLTFVLLLTAVTGAWADVDDQFVVGNVSYIITSESPQEVYVNGYSDDMPADYDLVIPSSVTNPDNSTDYAVTGINNTAFSINLNLKSVTIPSSVTSIGDYAFDVCTNLATVNGCEGVTSIGISAFASCSNLTAVTIPASVTSIGNNAFYDCANLTSITIPAGVESIGKGAFYDCANLTSITIPAGVESIGEGAFTGCTSLSSVTVDASNPEYSSDDGVLFNKAKTTLILYPAAKTATSYDIPASLTSIGNNAFSDCANLTSVTIPAGVESIGEGAFIGCSSLVSVTIPASVTSIGEYAFANCPNLGTITMNSSPLIDGDAFYNIKSGAAVTINAPANEADSYKWATFYNENYAFQADDDTQVFKVTLSGTKITLLEVADKIVDAGTPVVLKSSGEKPIMTWTTSSSSDEQGNDLKGTSEAITTPDNIYVLNYSTEHGVGFYKLATTGTLGVGKAYLEYDGASPSNFFGFEEGETTSIELKSSRIEELKYYDLNGRRVLNPTKGIYIVNGKKIIR